MLQRLGGLRIRLLNFSAEQQSKSNAAQSPPMSLLEALWEVARDILTFNLEGQKEPRRVGESLLG